MNFDDFDGIRGKFSMTGGFKADPPYLSLVFNNPPLHISDEKHINRFEAQYVKE